MDFHFRNRKIKFEKIPVIMGILNVTPDSFSDGGCGTPLDLRVRKIFEDGAEIIDIGGESTRPGAEEIPAEKELERVIPAVKSVRNLVPNAVISVDTRKAAVAYEALKLGADIINDISGLRFNPEMASVIARFKAGIILMHSRAMPENMQDTENTAYHDGLIESITAELKESVQLALNAGIPRENIMLDPGIGFAKTPEQCSEIISKGDRFLKLGFPLLSGPSRKSFIGKITGVPVPEERDFGTCGAVIASMQAGYSVVRVHNVRAAADSLKVFSACSGNL